MVDGFPVLIEGDELVATKIGQLIVLAIRKGLLEFAVLKVVGVDSVYAADILRRMQETEFATQEGTLYPLLSKLRRDGLVLYEWQ